MIGRSLRHHFRQERDAQRRGDGDEDGRRRWVHVLTVLAVVLALLLVVLLLARVGARGRMP